MTKYTLNDVTWIINPDNSVPNPDNNTVIAQVADNSNTSLHDAMLDLLNHVMDLEDELVILRENNKVYKTLLDKQKILRIQQFGRDNLPGMTYLKGQS